MGLRPRSYDEAADAVAELAEAGRIAVVVGGGTLLHVADPAPYDELVETTGLEGIVSYEPADLTITCRAGTTLASLERALSPRGQSLPVWHPDPERATIGGLAAFGWTGLGQHLYGRLRDRILEVWAVTGAGKLVRGGGKVVKNVTGFDLPRLFSGSMGTLGVIVELTLKVHPAPEPLYAVSATSLDLIELIARWTETCRRVRMPIEAVLHGAADRWTAHTFAPGPAADAQTLLHPFGDGARPADGDFRRLAQDPILCGSHAKLGIRAAVPPGDVIELASRLAGSEDALIDLPAGVAWASSGESEAVANLRSWAESCGGSVVLTAAPAGIRQRLGTWGSPPPGVEVMRRLKTSFDPRGILGPGRFVV